jgi:hypothetical protein
LALETVNHQARRFTRLTNGFRKKLECHAAAVSLYLAHYNWCRPHETLTPNARHQTTPARALGIAKHVRRRGFRVIEGGKK